MQVAPHLDFHALARHDCAAHCGIGAGFKLDLVAGFDMGIDLLDIATVTPTATAGAAGIEDQSIRAVGDAHRAGLDPAAAVLLAGVLIGQEADVMVGLRYCVDTGLDGATLEATDSALMVP